MFCLQSKAPVEKWQQQDLESIMYLSDFDQASILRQFREDDSQGIIWKIADIGTTFGVILGQLHLEQSLGGFETLVVCCLSVTVVKKSWKVRKAEA